MAEFMPNEDAPHVFRHPVIQNNVPDPGLIEIIGFDIGAQIFKADLDPKSVAYLIRIPGSVFPEQRIGDPGYIVD